MKVIFSHHVPFFLAHGGLQTQIESLIHALGGLGVEVETERWWDATQIGDVLQYFGRPPSNALVLAAKRKGFKVAMFENLDQTACRSRSILIAQRLATRSMRKLLPGMVDRMAWGVYRELDALIYATQLEWDVAQYVFGARPERGYVIGHGLEEEALGILREPAPESDYLISIATITERKNAVRLAEAAKAARVPVLFLGKPYSETDAYFRQFKALVDDQFVRYPGYVTEEEKHRLLRSARGFVLLSRFESGCIAVYEAAAAGLPLLLSDLPWATRVYGHVRNARFISFGDRRRLQLALSGFYENTHRGAFPSFPVPSWREVAGEYLAVYRQLLG